MRPCGESCIVGRYARAVDRPGYMDCAQSLRGAVGCAARVLSTGITKGVGQPDWSDCALNLRKILWEERLTGRHERDNYGDLSGVLGGGVSIFGRRPDIFHGRFQRQAKLPVRGQPGARRGCGLPRRNPATLGPCRAAWCGLARPSPRRRTGAFAASGAPAVRSPELPSPQPPHIIRLPNGPIHLINFPSLRNAPDGRRWSARRVQLRTRASAFTASNRAAATRHRAPAFEALERISYLQVVAPRHSVTIT
jgi:hypothetical protein